MKKLNHLAVIAAFCLLPSCKSESPKESNVTIEATDYKPLGEGIKFLSLALLGSTVVYSIASMVNNKNDDHD